VVGLVLKLVALLNQPNVANIVFVLALAGGTFLVHLWASEKRLAARLRPEIELSAEPAILGQELDIYVRLPDGLRTSSLEISLACEEIAVRSDDDVETHTEELHRQRLWSGRVQKSPFAKDLRVTIPAAGVPTQRQPAPRCACGSSSYTASSRRSP
jgi:hypothetical protein